MRAGGDKGGWCVSRIGAGDGADEFEWEAETDSGHAEEAGGGDVTEGTCAVLYRHERAVRFFSFPLSHPSHASAAFLIQFPYHRAQIT